MNTNTSSTTTSARTPTRRRLATLAAAGLAATGLAAAAVASPAHAATGRDLDARMTASSAHPAAHGHAEYDVDNSGREFEIRIKGVPGLAGHRLLVRVHGDLVGRMAVDRYGVAHLDRESGVPAMSAGNVVRVRTTAGILVSRGTLHLETGADTDD